MTIANAHKYLKLLEVEANDVIDGNLTEGGKAISDPIRNHLKKSLSTVRYRKIQLFEIFE